ncbi:MAG TPA: F0F1 ATP synthase subunit A [Anaerolineae bacterium]|nr:F0F1 ATP synthase subunit A [Anaerolineae bacterium]
MKKRYFIYLGLILLILFGGAMGSDPVSGWLGLNFSFSPVLPVIQLPGEVLFAWPEGSPLRGPMAFGNGFTNTFLATLLTFVVILLLAVLLKPRSRTADEVPTGFYNFFEMIYEGAYGYVQRSAGKWTKNFFPFFMTFILWILIANWMELVPGVDSIGKWENLPEFKAEVAKEEALKSGASEEEAEEIALEVEHEIEAKRKGALRRSVFLLSPRPDENNEMPEDAQWAIVPYVRAAATDLNFTLAIAIISVVMTQYYGMRAQGWKYWSKFFAFFPFRRTQGDAIAKNPLAVMDVGVGLLEFISEIFKIVSFAFRLLGNIFAGQVLLFVIASLLPIANLAFYFLEFGVGALQAVVFALLTLTFMSGAIESHH